MTPHNETARGPALTFKDVSLTLGPTEILRAIDLAVAPGSVHAVIGPNGGGKSSLIRCLLGQAPHRGTIAIDWAAPVLIQGKSGVIGYVPQALEFDRSLPMTVIDLMVSMVSNRPAFRTPRARTRDMIMDCLARVGMADKAARRVGALSGGERQRVLLAQALIPDPDLVVLDEPMAAFDDEGVRLFESLVADWKTAGITVLWIEHDLAAVRAHADRVTGLHQILLFDGEPAVELASDRLLTLFSHRAPGAQALSGKRQVEAVRPAEHAA